MKKLSLLLFCIGYLFIHSNSFAFRVYPTTAQNEKMFDKANFPFIAENADGFNLQYDCFAPFSESQVAQIFNQFTNKNFINHGVFKVTPEDPNGPDITRISTMPKRPSFANVTAMMLYSEAPAITTEKWQKALDQNVSFPLITHCRTYGTGSNFNSVREQILMTSGIMMEFQVTDPNKFDDAAEMVKFCVDNNRMAVFLTTFQNSPEVFISAYKEFYYYLKENLDPKYLQSDNVIFIPNTYNDSQVFPDTKGYGSTFGVAHWLIDQKTKITDGYIQPKITFITPGFNDYFENHSNISVRLGVTGATVSNVKLYVDDTYVGEDNTAPYHWEGGALNNLTTGYKNIRAVVTDQTGTETEKVLRINILKDPPVVPGFFLASNLLKYQLRNDPDTAGYIRHVYGKEWIDYKIDVKHSGQYDIDMKLKVQRSKQYGGTIIIKKGTLELGRYTTITNDPADPVLPGFTEAPDATIKNVPLTAGMQTLRVTFEHPDGIVKPQFYFYDFNFKIQGAPVIAFTYPTKNSADLYPDYSAPANFKIAANIASPRNGGSVKSASLYINNKLISTLTSAPYVWNKSKDIDAMKNLPHGDYIAKIVATDEKGFTSFEQIELKVIERMPFNSNLTIPGVTKAVDFDLGGEGVAYHDFNEGVERGLGGKESPRYPKETIGDVEIERSGADYVVSGIRNSEWLSYTMSDVQSGIYSVNLNTAANTNKYAEVKLWLEGKLIGTIATEPTGSGFGVYKNFSTTNVEIPENLQNGNLKIEFVNPDISTYLCFFKKFEFVKTGDVTSNSSTEENPDDNSGENPDDNTSVDKYTQNSTLNIYPKLTNSYFTVDLNDIKEADVYIYSMTGSLVYENHISGNNFIIHKNEISGSGVFLVKVYSGAYGLNTEKIVLY